MACERKLWPPHFRTFCELVEGEENKLTTVSTWTIMLGCNESNIISSSISANLGNSGEEIYKFTSIRSSNEEETNWPHSMARERNLWPPHFLTFCELVEGEENKLTTFLYSVANPFTCTIYAHTHTHTHTHTHSHNNQTTNVF